MFSIPDMGILGALALILFGPEKLPGMMRKAGKVMREVQNTSQSFVREMERAADLHEAQSQPASMVQPPAMPPPTIDAKAE